MCIMSSGGSMLVTFSIIPIGSGVSIGKRVAEVMRIVDASGLPYKLHPMGTVVEGDWDQVFTLIKKCHTTALKKEKRVYTTIAIDDRKAKGRRMDRKIQSVEERIGRPLKK